ncbi:nitrate- and nitrite sensing domain-containing protein [Saccharopolyspora sp. HNM0983]|uniref:Nitrate- and nitrite sensing domain-containing protein n=2 Tax=Saccharopolyspora montiporae TaxID=2781240 RepID=A0A929B8Z3_9PSEU|nr:nitrate- and nitrite sensing domain-containing protein [Saccharopolyspora sp. HNM0983]MBE9373257.1 nitrate- and nitrite sensing domain-containing protein [Saccharopolyspora sp. HNM0983]
MGSGRPDARPRRLRAAAWPGLVLLLVWLLVSSIAVHGALADRSAAAGVRAETTPVVDVLVAVQQERRLALQRLAPPPGPGERRPDAAALLSQRAQTDQALARLRVVAGAVPDRFAGLPQHREAVDAGTVPRGEVAAFYGGLLDAGVHRLDVGARVVADPTAGHQLRTAAELFRVSARMAGAAALADGALGSGGFTTAEHVEFARQVGGYRAVLEPGLPDLAREAAAVHRELVTGHGWRTLMDLQDQLISAAPGSGAPLPDGEQWRSTSTRVTQDLVALAVEQATAAPETGVRAADRELWATASVGAAGPVVLAAATAAVASRTRTRGATVGTGAAQQPEETAGQTR